MKLYLSKEIEYIPEWSDNQAAEEPIKFILKNLNSIERDECIDINIGISGNENVKADFKKLFRRGVIRIENLSNHDKEIKTADQFLDVPGLYDLFLEVATEILKANTGVDTKNSP